MQINPTWLNTFKSLVETGHFTQTAEKLYMTQPGVTQHIQKLEQATGHTLIIRENKSFSLTEQGRLVYQYACEQIIAQQDLMQALSFDDETRGQCMIASSGSMALALYPPLIQLQKKYPALQVELEVAPNHKILSAIEKDDINLGLVTVEPKASQFESEKVGHEPLVLITPKATHHAKKTNQSMIETLNTLGFIRHPDADHYLDLYLFHHSNPALNQMKAVDFPTRSYINQLQQILLPISEGIGFTVLPLTAVLNFEKKDQLHWQDEKNSASETLYLITKRGRTLPKRFDQIIQIIKSQVIKY